MVELSQLWLPILLTGVAVFFLSYLMWMVLPHHRTDWSPLPSEDELMDAVREMGVGGGQYAFPHCSGPEQYKDPAWLEKYNKGPKGFLLLKHHGPENMGKNLGVSFLFNVVTGLFVAYVATLGLAPGADKMAVFRFVWTVAFMANSMALVWGAIWAGRSWSGVLKEMFDGLVYGAATGLLFMAFWPGAPGA